MVGRASVTIDTCIAKPPAVRRYDRISVALHWLTVLLLLAMFGTAWAREAAAGGDSAASLLEWHRSMGVAVWTLTLARLLWKTKKARQPRLPASMSRIQRRLARGTEMALYILLLTQPISGVVQSVARGKALALDGLTLPALMARDKGLTQLAHAIHEKAALVLLALIGLHALAAMFHGIVRRDGVLQSMLPGA
jgi:cytochrome b561